MTYLPDRPNMFKATQRSCMKCIREHDPLRYKEVTNAESDLLGFRLHLNKSDVHINDDVTTNVKDSALETPPIDDEISELHSPSPIGMSPSHKSFCNVWFQSDSPHFSSVNWLAIDKIDKKGNTRTVLAKQIAISGNCRQVARNDTAQVARRRAKIDVLYSRLRVANYGDSEGEWPTKNQLRHRYSEGTSLRGGQILFSVVGLGEGKN